MLPQHTCNMVLAEKQCTGEPSDPAGNKGLITPWGARGKGLTPAEPPAAQAPEPGWPRGRAAARGFGSAGPDGE